MAEAPNSSGPGQLGERFLLEIVTPDRQLVAEEVEALTAPGIDGEFGVLPDHTRLMAALGVGEVAYRQAGRWHRLAVASGFVQVLPDRVILLAQTAELTHEIDLARAEAAAERARRRLQDLEEETDIERAQIALERALVRVQAARAGEADVEGA